jgi:ribosome maturation protein Sdo1
MLTFHLLHRHGNQGILDGASKGTLESEFGTSNEDEVVKQILEKGSVIESTVSKHCLQE